MKVRALNGALSVYLGCSPQKEMQIAKALDT